MAIDCHPARISGIGARRDQPAFPTFRDHSFLVSVPIRGAEREEAPIGTGVVDAAGKRRTREQACAIGLECGAILADRVRPVGVEQRRRSGCIGQRESIASRPLSPRQCMVEPGVDRIERGSGLRDTVRIPSVFRAARIEHDHLHRAHHMAVEHAIEHPYRHGGLRISRDQRHRAGVKRREMLDDRAGFEHRRPAIDEQREPRDRPPPRQLRSVLRMIRIE